MGTCVQNLFYFKRNNSYNDVNFSFIREKLVVAWYHYEIRV